MSNIRSDYHAALQQASSVGTQPSAGAEALSGYTGIPGSREIWTDFPIAPSRFICTHKHRRGIEANFSEGLCALPEYRGRVVSRDRVSDSGQPGSWVHPSTLSDRTTITHCRMMADAPQ